MRGNSVERDILLTDARVEARRLQREVNALRVGSLSRLGIFYEADIVKGLVYQLFRRAYDGKSVFGD